MASQQTIPLSTLSRSDIEALESLASRVLDHFEAKKSGACPAEDEDCMSFEIMEVKTKTDPNEAGDKRAALYARPVYTQLTLEDVQAVLAKYDNLGRVTSFRDIPGGLSNSNYRVDTDNGPVLLKVCEEKTVEELHVQIRALEIIRKHALPAAYHILARDGQAVVHHNGSRIVLYDFLKGSVPKKVTRSIMQEFGRVCAMLHSIDEVPDDLPDFPMGRSQMVPFLQEEVLRSDKTDHDFVKLLGKLLADLEGPLGIPLPERILHGDIFLENSMFDGDKIVGLIDFEEVCHGPALLDVAMTIVGCCYDANNALDWDLTEAYLQSYNSLLPFNVQEKQLFLHYLLYSLLSIAFWRFRQFQIRRPDAARCDSYKQMTDRISAMGAEQQRWSELLARLV